VGGLDGSVRLEIEMMGGGMRAVPSAGKRRRTVVVIVGDGLA
jgi:hypothetical protein